MLVDAFAYASSPCGWNGWLRASRNNVQRDARRAEAVGACVHAHGARFRAPDNGQTAAVERAAFSGAIATLVLQISVVEREEIATGHRDVHEVTGDRDNRAGGVDDLEGYMRDVPASVGYGVVVRDEADGCCRTRGSHLVVARGPVAPLAHCAQHAGLVRHVPLQMQLGCRRVDDRKRVSVPAARCALRGELEALLAHRPAIKEKLDAVTICISQYGNHLASAAAPIPMWEEMQHWPIRPLALIQKVGVLGMAGDVEYAGGKSSERPDGLAEVVDASPHEIAREVVVHRNPLPTSLGLQHSRRLVRAPDRGIGAERVALVEALKDRTAFRADHPPIGMKVAVLLGEQLSPLVPPVDVIVA